MRKTRLWWTAVVTGLLGAAIWTFALTQIWSRFEHVLLAQLLVLGIALLAFAWVAIGWKRPLVAGWLFIAETMLFWGFVAVLAIARSSPPPLGGSLSVAILWLPFLVSGILFLLAARKNRTGATERSPQIAAE